LTESRWASSPLPRNFLCVAAFHALSSSEEAEPSVGKECLMNGIPYIVIYKIYADIEIAFVVIWSYARTVY